MYLSGTTPVHRLSSTQFMHCMSRAMLPQHTGCRHRFGIEATAKAHSAPFDAALDNRRMLSILPRNIRASCWSRPAMRDAAAAGKSLSGTLNPTADREAGASQQFHEY
jgi:hypothetical protein